MIIEIITPGIECKPAFGGGGGDTNIKPCTSTSVLDFFLGFSSVFKKSLKHFYIWSLPLIIIANFVFGHFWHFFLPNSVKFKMANYVNGMTPIPENLSLFPLMQIFQFFRKGLPRMTISCNNGSSLFTGLIRGMINMRREMNL